MSHSLPALALFLAVAACGSAVASATEDGDGGVADASTDALLGATPPEGDAGVHGADSEPPPVCGAAATQVPLESAQAVKDYLGIDRWAWEACETTELCPASEPLLLFVNERYEEQDDFFMGCGHFCDESDGGVCVAERRAEHSVELVDAGAGRYELRTGFDDLAYSFVLTAWSAEGPAIQLEGQSRAGDTFRKVTAPVR